VSSRELVVRWAEAINERDLDTLLSLAHEDIEIHPLQMGLEGSYRGRDQLRAWVQEVTANDLRHTVRIEGVRELADDRLALIGTVVVDGRPLSPYALIALVRDGKIAAMRSYLGDEQTLELLGVFG
jgi:ketosteroid isomerase-like protein